MVIDSDLPPVPLAALDELLLECLEALEYSGMDGDQRETHIQFLAQSASDSRLSAELREILKEVADIFLRQRGIDPMQYVMSKSIHRERVAALLSKELGPVAARYVYHGTIFGRLAGIAKDGLVPGRFQVWSDDYVPREHCDTAVFFTKTWRGAIWWAQTAHLRSRGRRGGRHRTPAIIRLPANGLALEPDPRAAAPGCLMVRSSVLLAAPHVISGQLSGFPLWRPLAEVLATK